VLEPSAHREVAAEQDQAGDQESGRDARETGPGEARGPEADERQDRGGVEQQELRREIEAGLAALPPEYRAVLVLREMQQLRYDEISQVLGLDVGTVKSRISRGRKKLRAFLLERGNFSPPPPSAAEFWLQFPGPRGGA